MTNSNNQLIKLSNTELTNRYSNTLKEKYQTLKQEKTRLAYQKYPESTGLKGFLEDLNGASEQIANKRNELTNISEPECLELAEKAFQNDLHYLANYLNKAVKNLQDNQNFELVEIKREVTKKEGILMEQKTELSLLQEEITELKKENNQLTARIDSLRERLQKIFGNQQFTPFQSFDQKLILDTSSLTIGQLKLEYADLQEKNQTLQKQNKELSARLILDRDINQSLLDRLERYESQTEQRQKVIQSLANEKAWLKEALVKWEALNKENIAKFNATAFENAQLSSEIINLNDIIAQGTKLVDSLNENLSKKNQKIQELEAALNLSQQKERINLLGKSVKWASRVCLPTSWATGIEIGIDAYELKQTVYPGSYELVWVLVGGSLVLFLSRLFFRSSRKPKSQRLTKEVKEKFNDD